MGRMRLLPFNGSEKKCLLRNKKKARRAQFRRKGGVEELKKESSHVSLRRRVRSIPVRPY